MGKSREDLMNWEKASTTKCGLGGPMERGWRWRLIVGGILLCGGSGCTVQQQQQVLGTIGAVIPGSSTSVLTSRSNSSPADTQSASTPPAPRIEPARVDAQWILRTLQQAMTDNPKPFQECLENAPCKTALSAHLIGLQKQAGSTLELPSVYDRYDLERGKE
jgi:hypothetical protein